MIKAENWETKNILIDEKNYNGFVICFTRYVHSNSIKILSLHYHELTGKIEEHKKIYDCCKLYARKRITQYSRNKYGKKVLKISIETSNKYWEVSWY